MPTINQNNYNDLKQFVSDNISEYNKSIKPYEYNEIKKQYESFGFDLDNIISATDIRPYLKDNFKAILSDPTKKARLIQRLKDIDETAITGTKKAIFDIANSLLVSKDDVAALYKQEIFKCIASNDIKGTQEYQNFMNRVKAYANSFSSKGLNGPSKYLGKDLETCGAEALYWLSVGGFFQNLTYEVAGTQNANAGDSAQFIFVARAILAGYNCSNVDVRSSSYDAIISEPNTSGSAINLKTVQIKGLMTGSDLPLKKRARGGSGSNSKQGRNRAQYLSSREADLLAAVDKRFGTCYLIPMKDVDSLVVKGAKDIKWSDLQQYKENWEKIV